MMTSTNTHRPGSRLHRAVAGTGAAIAGLLLLAGCAASGSGDGGGDDAMNGHGQGGHQSQATGDWNEADVMFAQMMIPHHEQAIEMSDLILAKEGVDAEVVELAEEIKAAQGPEIEQMESWLEEWDMPGMPDGDMDDMGMEGLLSDDEMDELEAADAADGTTLFLEGMIEHHEGAVEMAEEHQEQGESEEALDLSAAVIETQTAEIERMRELLER